MKGIDFTQLHKETLEITMRTGITIHILPPTLEMVGDLQSCGEDLGSIKRALSKILSHNKELIKITEEEISTYDFEDLTLLANSVRGFVLEITSKKH